jgi:DNA-binding CsgD family transcriptional regulator
MQADQLSWSESGGWRSSERSREADLVLFFGTRQALACGSRYRELQTMYPRAHLLGCSTGGQIRNDDVTDDEIAAAALRFEATGLRMACEPAPTPGGELTKREQEILEILADGASNQQIARTLGLSLKTVQNHVSRILDKLQATDRTQAALRARGIDPAH